MNNKHLLIFLVLMMILITGCQKNPDINLKLGQTLVEVMDNEFFYFEEFIRVDHPSYKGKTMAQFVEQYYHGSFDTFIKSNWVVNVQNNEKMNIEDCESNKDSIVVDFSKYTIKAGSVYVTVPGTIQMLFASENRVDYELIDTSTLKITDWKNETALNIAYLPGDQAKFKTPKDNFVLFDYSELNKMIYKEKIAVKVEDYGNGNVVRPLEDWLEVKGYENYDDLLEKTQLRWAINKDKVTSKQLKKYDNALVLSLGKIASDTYIRVPKEILFITDDVKYQYIDEKTLLIKKGNVMIIYKD